MQLQYRFEPKLTGPKINYEQSIVCLGSCFAENMGRLLQQSRFNAVVNPVGIVFNPINLIQHIRLSLEPTPNFEELLFEKEGIWHSWLHQGSFYATSKSELIHKLAQLHLALKDSLLRANHLILTWGNAWIYQNIHKQIWVANCHKVPSTNFTHFLVQPETIAKEMSEVIASIKQHNPSIHIMLSISPVKYLRWGAHENNLGKASLFLALKQVVETNTQIQYFPAFEIMNDELRDYRFYEEDWAHPNPLAIKYIWEKFVAWNLDEASKIYLKELNHLQAQQNHRLLNPESEASKLFQEKLKELEITFKAKYPDQAF